MDSHHYVDQYIRRKKGTVFASATFGATDSDTVGPPNAALAAAAQNIILSATQQRSSQHYHHQQQQHQEQQQQHSRPSTLHQTASPPPADSHATTEHRQRSELAEAQISMLDRTRRQMANCIERTEALNLQVTTLEDKLVNVTKMIKLMQQLGEDREANLQSENASLKEQVRALEGDLHRQAAEFKTFQNVLLPSLISDAMAQLRGELTVSVDEQLRRAKDDIERRHGETRSDILSACQTLTDASISKRMAGEVDRIDEALAEVQDRTRREVRQLEQQMVQSEEQRIEHTQRLIEDRIATNAQGVKDNLTLEFRTSLRTTESAIRDELDRRHAQHHEDVSDCAARIDAVEQHGAQLDGAVSDFLVAFKDHQAQQDQKGKEQAAHFKEIMQLQEATRTAIASELEGTKQWASRNMQRLVKHLDLVTADVKVLRETQIETLTKMSHFKKTHHDDTEKLLKMLAEKTKEAAHLSEMVDHEIDEIHTITKQHRRGAAESQRAAEQQQEEQMNAMRAAAQQASESVAQQQEALDRYAERARRKRAQAQAFYNELAFPDAN